MRCVFLYELQDWLRWQGSIIIYCYFILLRNYQGAALYIIRNLLRYIINTKCCISSSRRGIQPSADDIRLWRWYTRLRAMICQACGLDKKSTAYAVLFWWRQLESNQWPLACQASTLTSWAMPPRDLNIIPQFKSKINPFFEICEINFKKVERRNFTPFKYKVKFRI